MWRGGQAGKQENTAIDVTMGAPFLVGTPPLPWSSFTRKGQLPLQVSSIYQFLFFFPLVSGQLKTT